MALLFMDGFDVGDYAIKGWNPVLVNGTVTSVAGRIAGNAILADCSANNSNGSECRIERPFTAASQATIGFALKINTYGTVTNGAFYVNLAGDNGLTTHLTLTNNPTTRYIELRRGTYSGTVLATYNYVLPAGAWAYFEIQATIADAGGVCQVRLNGGATPVINFSGDTKNGGTNTTVDVVRLGSVNIDTGSSQSGVAAVYDDLYILNSTGSVNTTFLGDIRVQSLMPNGNGTDSMFMGSDGNQTDNYLLVDESPYSTTDYTASPGTGTRDTYALSNLASGTTQVFGVQNNAVVAKSDATPADVSLALRVGGSVYNSGTFAPSTSYSTISYVHELNPNTSSAWTPGAVDGMEAGVEVPPE